MLTIKTGETLILAGKLLKKAKDQTEFEIINDLSPYNINIALSTNNIVNYRLQVLKTEGAFNTVPLNTADIPPRQFVLEASLVIGDNQVVAQNSSYIHFDRSALGQAVAKELPPYIHVDPDTPSGEIETGEFDYKLLLAPYNGDLSINIWDNYDEIIEFYFSKLVIVPREGGGSGAVTSVNGQIGKVVLTSEDVGAISILDKATFATKTDLTTKQDELVSGTNIKTINNQSILGSGNIEISGGGSTTWDEISGKPNFATVSTTGSYNDLSDKPEIPSIEGLATETFVNTGLSNKVDKVEGKELSSNDFSDANLAKLNLLENYDDTEIRSEIGSKQNQLVSGTNIKTINNQSLLEGGDIAVTTENDLLTALSDITVANINLLSDSESREGTSSATFINLAIPYTLVKKDQSITYSLTNNSNDIRIGFYLRPVGGGVGVTHRTTVLSGERGTLIVKNTTGEDRECIPAIYAAEGQSELGNYSISEIMWAYGNTEATWSKSPLEKQDTLESGVNIKTINNQSLLGSGNIIIEGGGGGGSVDSVNGQTGAVILNAIDVQAIPESDRELFATTEYVNEKDDFNVKIKSTSSEVVVLKTARVGDVLSTPIKILGIGNSFTEDAMYYLSTILYNLGVDYIIGRAQMGDSSLKDHYNNINTTSGYVLHIATTTEEGSWYSIGSQSLTNAIEREDWDIVTFQQVSSEAGLYSTIEPYLQPLIDFVKSKLPNTRIGWHSTWAYSTDCTHSGYANYNNDQMTMYDAIIETTKLIQDNFGDINYIIPNTKVIQDARKIPLLNAIGDELTRDGYHLDLEESRFLAALGYLNSIIKVNYDVPTNVVYSTLPSHITYHLTEEEFDAEVLVANTTSEESKYIDVQVSRPYTAGDGIIINNNIISLSNPENPILYVAEDMLTGFYHVSSYNVGTIVPSNAPLLDSLNTYRSMKIEGDDLTLVIKGKGGSANSRLYMVIDKDTREVLSIATAGQTDATLNVINAIIYISISGVEGTILVIDNTKATMVSSVNNKIGVVVLDAEDVGAIPITEKDTFATKTELSTKVDDSDLSIVAKSGNYNDLSNKPIIPSIEGLATTIQVETAKSEAVLESETYTDTKIGAIDSVLDNIITLQNSI